MPEKTLQKAALEEYLDGGFNPAAVIKQVYNGKGAMPAFGGRLSDDDIADVAGECAYAGPLRVERCPAQFLDQLLLSESAEL